MPIENRGRMLLPHPLPRPPATWKRSPSDFVVEEIPAYDLEGQGEHYWVEVTRQDMSTAYLMDVMARHLQLSPRAIGYAGLKDRCAVARQRFSIQGLSQPPSPPPFSEILEWKPLGWHPHKLKRGHLKGNRFELVIQCASPQIDPIVDRIREQGWANYYGKQRFGRDSDNQVRGKELLARPGGRHDLLTSAYQSHLYNLYLENRVTDGCFGKVLDGDLCARLPEGGMFVVEDPDLEQARLETFEISHTGPMFGFKMRTPQGESAAREEQVLLSEEVRLEDFRRIKAPGSRRRSRLPLPADFQVAPHPDGLKMTFSLPAGSYATVLLEHFFRGAESQEGDDSP